MDPHMGFSGLQAGFSRYVLSIGTPLEEWLKHIADTAQQEQNPPPSSSGRRPIWPRCRGFPA